jgi:dienelactone hydrolase
MALNPNDSDNLVHILAGPVSLEGNLALPHPCNGVVLFAHGSGSSRFSPRNQFVAGFLQEAKLATLLIDLLTTQEEEVDARTRHLRFDIGLLAERLIGVVDWIKNSPSTKHLPLGLFGASTGAAAALVAAGARSPTVAAVVSRGGRPDLAGPVLEQVAAPTLLIVGGADLPVIALNEQAVQRLVNVREKNLVIIPGATHLFEEEGALPDVARLATDWFVRHLTRPTV